MTGGCWGWFLRNVLCQDDEQIPDNSRVIHVKSEHQYKELVNKGKRSVVVALTAKWSTPCRYINPAFHELSIKYPNTLFLKVDVDELKAVAKSCGATTMPTFQFLRNGVKCDEMRGADRKGLEKRIQKHNLETDLAGKSANGSENQRKSQVLTITSEEQWEQLLHQNKNSGKALVVDFWASWCEPCVKIAPFFEELSDQFPAALFARVDVDELEPDTELFEVSSLPNFKVFKRGEVADELSGAIRGALESMVARHAVAASC